MRNPGPQTWILLCHPSAFPLGGGASKVLEDKGSQGIKVEDMPAHLLPKLEASWNLELKEILLGFLYIILVFALHHQSLFTPL